MPARVDGLRMSFIFMTAFGAFPDVLISDNIRVLGRYFDASVMKGLRALLRPVRRFRGFDPKIMDLMNLTTV